MKDPEQPLETHRLASECEILECEVKCDSIDPCGQVSGGYIKIHGPVKMATCEPSYGSMHCYDYNVAALLSAKPASDPRDCMGLFDVREFPKGRQIWCLQITTAFGLMLVPNVGEAGTFCRVGKCFLRCVGPEAYVDWFEGSSKETVIIV